MPFKDKEARARYMREYRAAHKAPASGARKSERGAVNPQPERRGVNPAEYLASRVKPAPRKPASPQGTEERKPERVLIYPPPRRRRRR